MDPKLPKFDTLSVHGGTQPDSASGARAVPIYQTTSYNFQSSEHAASLFNLEVPGYIYSRISNPTVAVLEERLAALEGGVASVATASGHAAFHIGITSLLSQGDHIVASRSLYGGSINLLAHTLPRFGITTTFVDARDIDAFRDAIQPDTRLIHTEVLGNPGLEVANIPSLAQVAHDAKLPLMVDSTFATPYLCRPFDHGANIIVHSLTKWLGGHGLAIGGGLVDGGNFDWDDSGLFPTLSEPYDAYHGIRFTEEFGVQALAVRARTEGLRDFGACLSPQNAFYILQGIETLSLRMDRHIANTHKVLDFLTSSANVDWVTHPDLPEHPDHKLAQKLLPKGAGSVISFGLHGGRTAGAKFIEACNLASHLANVGDAKTLVLHPASTTHQQMSDADLKTAGIGEDMIRLSVGIEDADDIIDDLSRAIAISQK